MVMVSALRQQRLVLALHSPRSFQAGAPVSRCHVSNQNQLVHLHARTQGSRFLGENCKSSAIFPKNVRSWPAFKDTSRGFQGQVHATYGGRKEHAVRSPGAVVTLVMTAVRRITKAVGVVILVVGLIVAGTPAYLSWPKGLSTAVAVVNHFIPGTLSVKSAFLGWTKPVRLHEIRLQGIDGSSVLDIPKVESKAPLWSIVLGRAGLGETTVASPVIDYQPDEKTGLPRLALALAPEDKLQVPGHARRTKKLQVKEKPVTVDLESKIAVPEGKFEVKDGKLVLPADLAAALGKRVHVEVSGGKLATDLEGDLLERAAGGVGMPLTAGIWAECVEAKAAGLFHSRQGRLELIKPILVEADLTPELARIYLVRVNPLLGDILGPAVRDEDMPDVVVHVTTKDMLVPADQYVVQIDPMKVILGRGPLINGILSLLSKERNVAPASRELTMQTSSIEANLSMQGDLECSRMDVLVAGNVHVATWGYINWIQETMKLTIAIPGSTLERLLGLSGLPDDYYLKIPVSGTFERPAVDWKAAGVGIAQLTLRQRGGSAFLNVWNMLDGRKEQPAPQPKHPLPWKLP